VLDTQDIGCIDTDDLKYYFLLQFLSSKGVGDENAVLLRGGLNFEKTPPGWSFAKSLVGQGLQSEKKKCGGRSFRV